MQCKSVCDIKSRIDPLPFWLGRETMMLSFKAAVLKCHNVFQTGAKIYFHKKNILGLEALLKACWFSNLKLSKQWSPFSSLLCCFFFCLCLIFFKLLVITLIMFILSRKEIGYWPWIPENLPKLFEQCKKILSLMGIGLVMVSTLSCLGRQDIQCLYGSKILWSVTHSRFWHQTPTHLFCHLLNKGHSVILSPSCCTINMELPAASPSTGT